jgi:DNA invertase Pin-like site-specific DNA recombinase
VELRKLLERLRAGDTLVVTRLDRLARSTRDLLNVLDGVKQAGAGFRSIKDSWADTIDHSFPRRACPTGYSAISATVRRTPWQRLSWAA